MATQPCKKCTYYSPLQKVVANKRTKTAATVDLSRGYCLKRTIFPENKPGNPVYPPNAIVQELPNSRAKVHLVHQNDIVPSCTLYKERA